MVTPRGTRLRRDYSKTEWREPGEGYDGEEPTKGLYPLMLVDVAEHTSGEGNDSVHWTFQMTEEAVGKNGDSYTGWRGHIYTNDEGALWKEQQIMVALGAIKPNGSYNGTLEALLKKYGKVVITGRVVRERYIPDDGGEGEWRAKLVTIMKSREDGSPARGRNRDDEDVDNIDEDEVEEKPTRRSRRKADPEPEPTLVEVEEEEEPEEEYDLQELEKELESTSLVALKKRAREEFGHPVSKLRGLDKDDIIILILDTLEESEEEEDPEEVEEEEPEPPKRTRGGRAGAVKSSSRTTSSGRISARRGKANDEEDEPPF